MMYSSSLAAFATVTGGAGRPLMTVLRVADSLPPPAFVAGSLPAPVIPPDRARLTRRGLRRPSRQHSCAQDDLSLQAWWQLDRIEVGRVSNHRRQAAEDHNVRVATVR
jgi:hypothetical protein